MPTVAIIGSGYGGAVAARHLTARGVRVDLIEMGADWDAMPAKSNGKVFDKMSQPTERSMWFKDRTDMPFAYLGSMDLINRNIGRAAGVLDIEYFDQMKVYVGRGVGGGSLVNGGMAVTPGRSYFQKVLPQVDAAEMYGTYFPRANAELQVSLPPRDVLGTGEYYQFARTSARHAAKAGYDVVSVPNVYDWDYMRREQVRYKGTVRSALDQEVIFGNNHGKRSLPRTILAAARATGLVNVIPFTEVTRVVQSGTGYTLSLKTIDFSGAVVSERTAQYDKVVLAAGSLGTTRIVARAKAQGDIPGLAANTEVGAGWGPNGNTMLARRHGDRTNPLQSGIPALGIRAWDDSDTSVFAEIAPFPTSMELNTSVYLAITGNSRLASLRWDATRGLVNTWTSADSAPSVAAVKAVFDRINAAVPGSSYRTDLFEEKKSFTDYFTYHPLGGMVIGKATDANGEVVGAPNMFVVDGSLVPGRIGVNPFVTITALAERNMDKLAAAGRL
ncbi:GMC oxidoreductase [Micrococcus sp.]|uniref:GMC oxidoreductase n=1 Tax=Micrococcus sp. TaxID=1271 RepID=UPI002A91D96E|nr:GMC oxidoreductase [Micrococcus sp.]MDY6054847.1 GMC oxidoreductase [Micrococcus sp.]